MSDKHVESSLPQEAENGIKHFRNLCNLQMEELKNQKKLNEQIRQIFSNLAGIKCSECITPNLEAIIQTIDQTNIRIESLLTKKNN